MAGFVAWSGPSPVTGDPVVLVITGQSFNEKTGPMFQAWLLLRDVSPFEALRNGHDRAICGDCFHRGGAIDAGGLSYQAPRTCYVSMYNGPIGIWRTMQTGGYPTLTPDETAERLSGEYLRVTAYGDPAFVPFAFWETVLAGAAGWTGYTHQWANCDSQFRTLLMASVESEREADEAHARGWRTYRARPRSARLRADEFACPASDEMGHRTTCARCQLCRGTSSPAKSVAILMHGRVAAPRERQLGKYDALRADLEQRGFHDRRVSFQERQRVVFALSQHNRRHSRPGTVRTKHLGDGIHRFWIEHQVSEVR